MFCDKLARYSPSEFSHRSVFKA
jgi:hypothetical protein